MTREEEVYTRAKAQFPGKTEEELQEWCARFLERHPGFDKLPTNASIDIGALTSQQSRMASRFAEKEKLDAARHGEIVALFAETGSVIAKGLEESTRQSIGNTAVLADKIEHGLSRLERCRNLLAGVYASQQAHSRRSLWIEAGTFVVLLIIALEIAIK